MYICTVRGRIVSHTCVRQLVGEREDLFERNAEEWRDEVRAMRSHCCDDIITTSGGGHVAQCHPALAIAAAGHLPVAHQDPPWWCVHACSLLLVSCTWQAWTSRSRSRGCSSTALSSVPSSKELCLCLLCVDFPLTHADGTTDTRPRGLLLVSRDAHDCHAIVHARARPDLHGQHEPGALHDKRIVPLGGRRLSMAVR